MGKSALWLSRLAGGNVGGDLMRADPLLRSRVQAWQGFLAFGALGTLLYLFVPPFKGNALLINTLGLSSFIAVVVGIRRNRPSYALPWWLFAVGICLFWMGDVYTYSYPTYILHHDVPFPSIGDAIYLIVYPALFLGLLLLVRRRNPQRNRNTLIDAAILTLGLSLLSWVLLIAPYLHDPTLGLLPKLVSVAYPLGDVILLAAAIRLVLDSGPRRPAFYLPEREHRLAAGDGLRLRGDDPRQRRSTIRCCSISAGSPSCCCGAPPRCTPRWSSCRSRSATARPR